VAAQARVAGLGDGPGATVTHPRLADNSGNSGSGVRTLIIVDRYPRKQGGNGPRS